jgi:hypothetical protein
MQHGQMTEDWVRYHQLEPHDIKTVFENLKADYRNLKLIRCRKASQSQWIKS